MLRPSISSIFPLTALLIALGHLQQCTAQKQPIASGLAALQTAISLSGATTPLAQTKPVSAPAPVLAPGQNVNDPSAFLLYNADAVHYPFTVGGKAERGFKCITHRTYRVDTPARQKDEEPGALDWTSTSAAVTVWKRREREFKRGYRCERL